MAPAIVSAPIPQASPLPASHVLGVSVRSRANWALVGLLLLSMASDAQARPREGFWRRALASARTSQHPVEPPETLELSLTRILEGRGRDTDPGQFQTAYASLRREPSKLTPEALVLTVMVASELGYLELSVTKEPEVFLLLGAAVVKATESGAKARSHYLRARMLANENREPSFELRAALGFASTPELREELLLALTLEEQTSEDQSRQEDTSASARSLESEVVRVAEESDFASHRALALIALYLGYCASQPQDSLRFLRSARHEFQSLTRAGGAAPWHSYAIRPRTRILLERLFAPHDSSESEETPGPEGVKPNQSIETPHYGTLNLCPLGGQPTERSGASHKPADGKASQEKKKR